MNLLNHPPGAFALSGEFRLVSIDFGRELTRTHNARPAAPPDCLELEHRHGVCPLGLSHHFHEQLGRNTIVLAPKESIIDQVTNTGTPMSLRVTAVAAGTSPDATNTGLTALVLEAYRAAPTEVIKVSTSKATVFWFYGTSVANAVNPLQEWGIMGGGATTTVPSGKLIGRFLSTFAKDATKTLSGQYDLTVN
jgi:hypothetical protein